MKLPRLDNLTIRQLRIFCTVARLLSYTRAAEELGCRQPTASALVAELERATQLTLFEQRGNMTTVSRPLRIAADTTVGTYVLPHLLGTFHLRYPNLALQLNVANRASVRAALLSGEVDLVIAGRPPEVEGLLAEPFLANPLAVISSPEHVLVGQSQVPLARLAEEVFFSYSERWGQGQEQQLKKYLRSPACH
jgi:DNA-binding transcriptional LysR family regulator